MMVGCTEWEKGNDDGGELGWGCISGVGKMVGNWIGDVCIWLGKREFGHFFPFFFIINRRGDNF